MQQQEINTIYSFEEQIERADKEKQQVQNTNRCFAEESKRWQKAHEVTKGELQQEIGRELNWKRKG